MKILSRKFILSVLLLITATWFLITHTITDVQWQIVMMATAMTYIGAKAWEKSKTVVIDYAKMTDRLTALLSREFVIALVIFIGTTALTIAKLVSGDIWFQIVTAIGASYNIFNAAGK